MDTSTGTPPSLEEKMHFQTQTMATKKLMYLKIVSVATFLKCTMK